MRLYIDDKYLDSSTRRSIARLIERAALGRVEARVAMPGNHNDEVYVAAWIRHLRVLDIHDAVPERTSLDGDIDLDLARRSQ